MQKTLCFSLLIVLFVLPHRTPFGQPINPNNLPPCPKPDLSKNSDFGRTEKWHNCWGRYKFDLDKPASGQSFEGEFANGVPHGFGTFQRGNNNFSMGIHEDGRLSVGVATFSNGDRYEGEFREGKKHGRGLYIFKNGDKVLGEFYFDKNQGFGLIKFINGDLYKGELRDYRFHGRGTLTSAAGNLIHGQWDSGKLLRQDSASLEFDDVKKILKNFPT